MTAPYPFTAIVGADDLRLALALSAVDPGVGGVLVRGEKGTAKSTAARGLATLLPDVPVVDGCRFACDPQRPDADCPDGPHAADVGARQRPARLVELPVGASEDRLVGSIDLERALAEGARRFEPGLLASAHRGVLYVDEVNLLGDHLVDALLDASASGVCTVEREGVSVRHAARFQLIGSMNPEEGELRPQLLDRFGLSVDVRASREPAERAEVVRRRLAHEADPEGFAAAWQEEEAALAVALAAARDRLAHVRLGDRALEAVVAACTAVEVDGLRADVVTARAAVAHAAWAGREEVAVADVRAAARLALPHRRRRGPFEEPGLDDDTLDEALREHAEAEAEASDERTGGPGEPEGGTESRASAGNRSAGPGEAGDAGGDRAGEPEAGTESRASAGNRSAGPGEADGAGGDRAGEPEAGTESRASAGNRSAGREEAGTAGQAGEADTAGAAGTAGGEAATRVLPAGERFQPVRLEAAGGGRLGGGPAVEGRRSPAPSEHGRHTGARRPVDPARPVRDVDLPASLRAAAPRLAARAAAERVEAPTQQRGRGAAVALRPGDLREKVREGREGNLVLFVVDASGSMAARRRMTAVKGAALSLLADAYQRRDTVGVVVFRGDDAEVALPPTTSVERAAARLEDLPTGGRTPLASGLERAADVIAVARRREPRRRPLLVLLTDGRATSAREDGDPVAAARDAAAGLAAQGVPGVVVDTEQGRLRLRLAAPLAAVLGAPCIRLDELASGALAGVVRTATGRTTDRSTTHRRAPR
ncbi:VWA domain-containing protein [Egibacter rhizosphaerae]|uniref:Mg-protoporphyrin IX chelatase n=1 Tax=Egibacter rhizosphaerae TaxID=1670831 RepID=A0A411YEY9_9ACTN|nr:VWA domain-containing protein [Egibacter rhizosphaerae]QBI19823.1 VWA domain-containing protein [Egibacter rhizosphaerae]